MQSVKAKVRAKVKSVIDGDTFCTNNKIRLARVYAPEINTVNGPRAKKKLETLVLGKQITYREVGTSYDRIVAEVWVNNISINDIMIRFVNGL